MIHLTLDDVCNLYFSCEPIGVKECGTLACRACNIREVCSALAYVIMSHKAETNHEEAECIIHGACVSFRDYTDKICDTYTCPSCPNYSWCTTLRGIAIEGVKLDTD